MLGPLNILSMGLTVPAITEAVRLERQSPRRMLRAVAALTAVLVVVFSPFGVVMYFLPTSAGEAILKSSWPPTHPVILPSTAVMAATAMLTGAGIGLRATAAARRSLNARLVTGALALALGTLGAAQGGAVGAAVGLAAGLWVGSVHWWWHLGAAVPSREASGSGTGTGLGGPGGNRVALPWSRWRPDD